MIKELTTEARALLSAIRNSESSTSEGGYNMRFSPRGGATFTDFSKHPRIFESVPWRKDGKKSSAAGAYQFTATQWDETSSKYSLPDFSPDSQDKAAWYLAQERYKAKTGDDLQTALQNGELQRVSQALSSTWTSLPSGSESNKKTKGFFSTFTNALANKPTAAGVLIDKMHLPDDVAKK